MDLFSRYAINTPDVVAEDFNGEIVILNLANGHYFSLCGIACAIWSLLLAGHTPHSIVASIEASRPDLVEGSSQFVERLLELQLILARGDMEASAEPIEELWPGDGPAIEVYDDLAELIFADPIHDVDEQAGWPTPRQTQ